MFVHNCKHVVYHGIVTWMDDYMGFSGESLSTILCPKWMKINENDKMTNAWKITQIFRKWLLKQICVTLQFVDKENVELSNLDGVFHSDIFIEV